MQEKRLQLMLFYFIFFIINVFLYFLNLLGTFNRAYNWTIKVMRPITVVISTTTYTIKNNVYSVLNITKLRNENLSLSAEVLQLQHKILDLQNKLAKCSDAKSVKNKHALQFDILDRFYGNVGYIEINGGAKQNIKKNNIVTFQGFLVGHIKHVFDYTSIVKTIYAPDFKQKVYFDKAKVSGILIKDPKGFFVHDILLKDKVLVNDKIYIINPVNNKKVYIGTVKNVKTPLSSPKKIVEIKPFVNLNDLNFVYIETK